MSIELRPVEPQQLPRSDNLLQTALWARLKSEFGWQAHCFSVEFSDRVRPSGQQPLVLLTRSLRGLVRIGYLPYPLASMADSDAAQPAALLAALRRQLGQSLSLLRLDLAQEVGRLPAFELRAAGLYKAPVDVQPPSTVVIDLDRDDQQLLAAMKSKTRYNIRLSLRKGVEVDDVEPQRLSQWYALYRETARRDRIVLHSFDYYRRLFELAAEDREVDLRLLFAEHGTTLLAGIVVAMVGGRATYLYGASSTEKRNLMASYAVQWRALQLARECNCGSYDLFGIPPADDPDHPMAGLYRFKSGFGGRVVHRPGCYDLPLQPLRYRLFSAAERLRFVYYKRVRKRLSR